jgi:hypothetical protein
MNRIIGLSALSLLSLIINTFASAPDNLLSKKLSVSFSVPANNAIGIHEFFLIDAVNSTNYYFKTSNDSSDSPFWLSELYHYRKTTSTDATLRIISNDGGWVDIVLSFASSNSASSTISGHGINGEVEWTGTADVSVLDFQISEIPLANQPNILTTDLSPTSIFGATLSAQDKYWPVYDETISFTTSESFSASITNGQDDPTGSGSYSYSKTGTNSASLSYSIDGAGISFEYALQFTAENTGIYTKFADYGGGSTDITTGPFSLSGVAIPNPVTVVSDPNEQPVVVQVGDEYQWNSTLDGVTLWGVWEDSEDGWIGATVAYENGVQKASIGLMDELGTNLEVNHPYIIDENGMIKVTEDTAFQYYQVMSVENGVIVTADDSSFPLTDTSRFFTTRTAAEEYYYAKVNPKDWMWFDHYPWVYSEEEGDWLYFYPSGGTLMYWSNKGQAWRQFN